MRCDGTLTRIPSTRHTRLMPVSNNTRTSENAVELWMETSYVCVARKEVAARSTPPVWFVRGSRARANRRA
jgi:hypothetical protein